MANVDDGVLRWAFQPRGQPPPKLLRPPRPADLADWRGERVGWGLILPHAEGLTNDELAQAKDAPEPIRELLADRPGSPVLRYQLNARFTHLVRHDRFEPPTPVPLSGAERGTGPGSLPHYLLIYATPAEIPWGLQYLLNQSAAVGRLTLTGDPLARYVEALIREWSAARTNGRATVIWSVAGGEDPMLASMRNVVAEPVRDALAGDDDLGPYSVFLGDGDGRATAARLAETLAARQPSLIVTTSHGYIDAGPDVARTRLTLGLPVDDEGTPIEPAGLLEHWQPDGAIWYAHACASAGTDRPSAYENLFPPGSDLSTAFAVSAARGPCVAPLPEALLGAKRPLRAFIGHIEPTFDWTIQHRATGQSLTASLRSALYDGVFQPLPIGHAFRPCFAHAGELFAARDQAYRHFNEGQDTSGVVLATQLAALDRQSVVILGDPTVALPAVTG
jgi:hypothetical protein